MVIFQIVQRKNNYKFKNNFSDAINNQSAFIKKFKRQYLSEQDFDYVFFDQNQPITLSAKSKIKGIILSGGKGNPYEPLNLTSNFVAMLILMCPSQVFVWDMK